MTTDIKAEDEFFVGDDFPIDYYVTDNGDRVTGTAVPITGWALEWVMRYRPGEAALLTKTTGAGITITDGAAGICQVVVSDTDTDNMPSGKYWIALRRTDAGNERTISSGYATLRAR